MRLVQPVPFLDPLVNPRQARDFGRASGQLVKTDRMDARRLAKMAASLTEPHRFPNLQAQYNMQVAC